MRVRIVVASLFLCLGLGLWGRSPDIVLISLDAFRANRLAAWGGPADLAPNLNAMSRGGCTFTRCFTSSPMALPADASLLTGCLPERTGLHDDGYGVLSPRVKTLAEILKAHGYDTHAVVATSVLDGRFGLDRGFDGYDDAIAPMHARNAGQVTDRALSVLSNRSRKPIFLWIQFADTHAPYAVGSSSAGAKKRTSYDRAVAYLDAELGRLLRALPKGAIVAVISEHGESLGAHGEITHGTLLFQPTMQAVWILSVPSQAAGRRISTPCSLADVAPTLLKSANIHFPASYRPDGLDALSEKADRQRAILMESWFAFDNFRWSPLFGVTDGRYKWVRSTHGDRLYDLRTDPGETRDISTSATGKALDLKASLPAIPVSPPAAGMPLSAVRGPALPGRGSPPIKGTRLRDPSSATATLHAMNEARNALERGHWGEASTIMASTTSNDPDNPTAWFEYGEALRHEGRPDDAIKAEDRALTLAPRMARAYVARGHAEVLKSKPDEAARCYRSALEIEPDLVSAVNALAAYHLDRNEAEKAFDLLGRAVAEGFADAQTYVLEGRIHLVQKKKSQTATDFQMALQLSTNPARTLKAEADVYLLKNAFNEALALYREGMRLYPAYAPNYLTLGTLYLQTDRPAEALPLYRKALNCDLDAKTRDRVESLVRDLETALKKESKTSG